MAASLSADQTDRDLPVEQWHPSHCGSMDLVIRADGSWVHEGTPMGRPALVRLFSRVLRKDPDGYVLVTPAEKISIEVEDVPFVVVDLEMDENRDFWVRTNVGDSVMVGPDHPIAVRSGYGANPLPYVRIRGQLEARFGRTAYYQLVEMASLNDDRLSVESGGTAFDLGAVT